MVVIIILPLSLFLLGINVKTMPLTEGKTILVTLEKRLFLRILDYHELHCNIVVNH